MRKSILLAVLVFPLFTEPSLARHEPEGCEADKTPYRLGSSNDETASQAAAYFGENRGSKPTKRARPDKTDGLQPINAVETPRVQSQTPSQSPRGPLQLQTPSQPQQASQASENPPAWWQITSAFAGFVLFLSGVLTFGSLYSGIAIPISLILMLFIPRI